MVAEMAVLGNIIDVCSRHESMYEVIHAMLRGMIDDQLLIDFGSAPDHHVLIKQL